MAGIEKAAVIGAGVMGASIAAHIANAGLPVVLLDEVPPNGADRNAIAADAIQRLLKTEPSAFMHRRNVRLVTPGNIEDHLGLLADADWIVEAVVERLDVKQSLYRRIDSTRNPGSIVSSNTSTLPLARLVDGMPESFARDFLITHFFNPPRYMRLLELVAGPLTRDDAVATIREFADVRLGKGVVDAKDTPGFIANRLGIYWLQCAATEAMRRGIDIETADAVLGRPAGVPKTGVFGLLDLIGLDLIPHVNASMAAALPPDDPFHAICETPELVNRLIADGYTGRKGKGGFYRLRQTGGARVKQAIDLATGEYHDAARPRVEAVTAASREGLRALVEHPSLAGQYAWRVLAETLSYAARLVPEVADDITAVDRAMRLGYNWRHGPFELIDKLGTAWFADRLAAEGMSVPPLIAEAAGRPLYSEDEAQRGYLTLVGGYAPLVQPPGVLLLADIKRRGEPVARNASASLWDIGDGVACLEFHSKMNALDRDSIAMLRKAVSIVPRSFKALVIYNEGEQFSVGANLGYALFAANIAAWPEIEGQVSAGQQAVTALRYAPFPVVGAPSGLALGGGCEVLLHCDAIQAHAESYMGQVEPGVGLIPGWGGCKELLRRWQSAEGAPRGPMAPVVKAFEVIGLATVAKSAAEARDLGFLGPRDGITMNRDRLLADAKARALALTPDYAPPECPVFRLPGPSGRATLRLAVHDLARSGKATPHDVVVAGALAEVLTGGDTDPTDSLDEAALLALEQLAFMRLIRTPATLARMEHMLETGKPLRN